MDRLSAALDTRQSIALSKARILVVGLAYKRNVADICESPALNLIEMLSRRAAAVDYHDPFVPAIPATRQYPELAGRTSVVLEGEGIARYHAVLIVTDHDAVDYALLSNHARLIVDTRNVMVRKGYAAGNVVPA